MAAAMNYLTFRYNSTILSSLHLDENYVLLNDKTIARLPFESRCPVADSLLDIATTFSRETERNTVPYSATVHAGCVIVDAENKGLDFCGGRFY